MRNYSGKPEALLSSEYLLPADCYVHLLVLLCVKNMESVVVYSYYICNHINIRFYLSISLNMH